MDNIEKDVGTRSRCQCVPLCDSAVLASPVFLIFKDKSTKTEQRQATWTCVLATIYSTIVFETWE